MKLHDIDLSSANRLELDIIDLPENCVIVVSEGRAKIRQLPQFGEYKIVTHQGKVKRMRKRKRGGVLNEIKEYIKKTDVNVYIVIITSLLIIIISQTYFIFTNKVPIKISKEIIIEPLIGLIGVFMGAWLAGRHAIKVTKMTTRENKLLQYEDFRKLLTINKRTFERIHDTINLLIKGNLKESDISLIQKDLDNKTNEIMKDFDISVIPADYLNRIKMIQSTTRKLNNYAFLYNYQIEGKELLDKEDAKNTNKSLNNLVNELFKELDIE